MFVGRNQELAFLNDKYTTPSGELVVLYGRRRIGKTELLRQFCKDKPHVFYSSREISDTEQLISFSERILSTGISAAEYIDVFRDWETALKAVQDIPVGEAKKLLIIDEFPYICKGNPSIPSILQVLWDESLKNQNVMIILCGSAMSFFEKNILSEKNPLHGRATGILKLNELPFVEAVKFFPDYSSEDKFLAYSILGGVPHYLQQFNSALPLKENIIKNILTKGCILYSEVEFLIRQEFREPAYYNTLVKAIALGNTQLKDIHAKTQIEKSKISVYLTHLKELQIIDREFSVLASKKDQSVSSRGLYRICDNFFRFWYKFVFANISRLEGGDAKDVYKHIIQPQLNDFASLVFETVCREHILNMNRRGEIPFHISEIGRWWGKSDKSTGTHVEIDIVATDLSHDNYLMGECKFRNSKTNLSDLTHLHEKAVIAKNSTNIYYTLFSKSGFSEELVDFATKDDKVMLFTLADIV